MSASQDSAVQVHIADPWASVPIRLLEAGCGLSLVARLVLVYMLDLGRRPGWVIYASQVQRALGLSESRWKRLRKELETHGYFTKRKGHAENGDWLWTYHLFDTPQAQGAQKSIGAKRNDAKSTDAKQHDRHSNTLHNSTSLKKQKQHRDRGACGPAAPAVEKRAAAAGVKRQQRPVAGVTCWTLDDAAMVEELVTTHGSQAVRGAATRLRAVGIDPLPSTVAKVLQEAARAALRLADEQEATRREAAERERRESAASAREARRDDPRTREAAKAAIAAMRKRLRV